MVLRERAPIRAAKNCFTSSLTKKCSAGSPSFCLASSTNFAPPSPCAFCVPATSAIPLPMSVRTTMNFGLPLFDAFAAVSVSCTFARSFPFSIRKTSKPYASKRLPVSSLCDLIAIASSVTSFESYMRIRLSSLKCAAIDAASDATPSCKHPSPASAQIV